MSKNKFQIIATSLLVLGIAVFFTTTAPAADPIPVVTNTDDYSTLTCSGPKATSALAAVLESYQAGGDAEAYREAQKAISDGVCKFDNRNSLTWDSPQAEYQEYAAVECQKLATGHCIAIQPVFVPGNSGAEWSGYMLVAPRIATSPRAEDSVISRPQKGLVMDMNF